MFPLRLSIYPSEMSVFGALIHDHLIQIEPKKCLVFNQSEYLPGVASDLLSWLYIFVRPICVDNRFTKGRPKKWMGEVAISIGRQLVRPKWRKVVEPLQTDALNKVNKAN